jgi:hypothetical protein
MSDIKLTQETLLDLRQQHQMVREGFPGMDPVEFVDKAYCAGREVALGECKERLDEAHELLESCNDRDDAVQELFESVLKSVQAAMRAVSG